MTSRPYFNKSIDDLETIFTTSPDDAAVCQTILNELGHRTTPRAQKLREEIAAARPASRPTHTQPTTARGTSQAKEPSRPSPASPPPPSDKRPRSAPGPKPPVTNDPQNVLRAWTALEVLSPQGYRRETDLTAGDRTRIASLDRDHLPWEDGEKSRPGKRLFYELILGTIDLGPAVESLLKVYADRRPDTPSIKQKSPLASILLDKEGRPLDEETTLAISSFAWGVPIALQGDLKRLADWPVQELTLIKAFREKLFKRDKDGELMPLTKHAIHDLYRHLVEVLQLQGQEIAPPSFAVRRYEFFASKVPPEPSLLNSFYLEDLASARELASNGQLPHVLRFYLGVNAPARRFDLLADDVALQHLMQPARTPIGRWPGNGRFPLALLQQAAVNATADDLPETGLLSVNGPPGTGKTTLLRDIVAARLLERAMVMATFDNPAQAFVASDQVLQRTGAKIVLHRLNPKLKGFEMVVASSNNKAVENVSAELPALDAIAPDAPNLRYFKSISDNVLQRPTWGMIAAVLGNSSNRYQFSQSFWRDEENGLSTYLNHVAGVPHFALEPQAGGAPLKRPRKVITAEAPPNNAREALARWQVARTSFIDSVNVARTTQAELQRVHVDLVKLVALAAELSSLARDLPLLEQEIEDLKSKITPARAATETADAALDQTTAARRAHQQQRPGFFAQLFQTQTARRWKREEDDLYQQYSVQVAEAESYRSALSKLQRTLEQTTRSHAEKKQKLADRQAAYQALVEQVRVSCEKLSAPVPDAAFFAGEHTGIQTASLWFDQAQQRERDDVFEKAMALHRAFIDSAADPLRQNLSIFLESFGTRSLGTPQKDAMIADLWSSFFLVVPVVSTTFASVNRMFSRLDPEAVGWLLVDEAGQAVPQAAVGAIMRAKRAVVVGDPLQIEPVVTLPNSLTEEICGYFGIDPLKYNAPEASVQTVADRASPYTARFPIGSGHRDVGAPLLVHRRCDSPMFDVSNEIAYSNLMVQAKRPAGRDLPLGPSRWIDVVGKPGPDKWCANEGTKLVEMLQTLRGRGDAPDLYVVTPFVIVQDNLRRELQSSGVLREWMENPDAWLWEHVGTVHTVQGREAETVFFVLGAQASSQNGARAWAGGRPNLANVAVTRAKSALYVIGNRELWKSAGVFRTLDRLLP